MLPAPVNAAKLNKLLRSVSVYSDSAPVPPHHSLTHTANSMGVLCGGWLWSEPLQMPLHGAALMESTQFNFMTFFPIYSFLKNPCLGWVSDSQPESLASLQNLLPFIFYPETEGESWLYYCQRGKSIPKQKFCFKLSWKKRWHNFGWRHLTDMKKFTWKCIQEVRKGQSPHQQKDLFSPFL